MPQQTRPNLQTDINTDIADNVTGAITAGDVRVNMINMTDSVPFLTGSNAFDGATTITGSLTLSGSSYPLIVKGKIDLNDGVDNIAVGAGALSNAGSSIAQNTAVGKNTLYNTLGNSNTGLGYIALFNNTGGGGNVAVGGESIRNNTSGNNNSSVGYLSLKNNTTGDGNTALGKEAGNEVGGLTGNDNTFLGHDASYGTATTITNSTAVGANVTLTNSNTVILGNNTNVGINNTNPTEKLTVQGNILASGNITGSAFTGSFVGDGSGLTGITSTIAAYTVSSLPAGTVGDRAYVTDATSPTYLGTLKGGGAVKCPVFYNGSAWVSA